MDFNLSDEQQMLAETVQRLVRDIYTFEHRPSSIHRYTPPGWYSNWVLPSSASDCCPRCRPVNVGWRSLTRKQALTINLIRLAAVRLPVSVAGASMAASGWSLAAIPPITCW